MNDPPDLIEATRALQRAASDPSVSAFVAANAGAGKTYVLTTRVARILLGGADPSKILCVTFTKAAAAEMSDRLFRRLGDWALAEDDALAASLADLEGMAKARTPGEFATARRLFARALETPGGLKIQTIHAFCENVLKRFPLEAGVAPGFSVIDDREAGGLAAQAVERAVAGADDRPLRLRALWRLQQSLEPDAIAALLSGALTSRQKFAARGDLAALAARAIGADPETPPEAIRDRLLAGLNRQDLERARAAFALGGTTCASFAGAEFETVLNARDPAARFAALRAMTLTQSDTPLKNVPDAKAKRADPSVGPYWGRVKTDVATAVDASKAYEAHETTAAFLVLRAAALSEYERMKAARAGLDFEDLVEKTRALFTSGAGHWVRYKLDEGLDHVLLDEAQDTSPGQWAVVESAIEEFWSGEGARAAGRSFFAVGDQKQSIYSFQGADADLFEEKRQDLGKAFSAVGGFLDETLSLSYRTSAPTLAFVDALFATQDVVEGMAPGYPLRHDVWRSGEWGRVELWPLLPQPEIEEARAWDAPLDQKSAESPARRLADAVARDIRGILDGPCSPTRGRRWRAGDFMILVQSRGPLFHEMIRSLMKFGVSVAGADRIKLNEEAAVEDALSYARAALFEGDDLALAETLKGPFFGVGEDQLFDLAYGRAGTLRAALELRRSERPEWAGAAAEIAAAARVGREEGAFAFFSHILESGAPSGRTRLYSRLGRTAEEPLGELMRQALDYENANPRSLEGFVLWARRNAGEIKRDLEQASDAARVMTVHGAKGLEADCVYLLDAHKGPNVRKLGPLLFSRDPAAFGAPMLAANKDRDCAATAEARAAARRRAFEEYRRLLYVAATRARDRLVICGHKDRRNSDPSAKDEAQKTWHALAVDAFARLAAKGPIGRRAAEWGADMLIIESPQTKPAPAPAPDAAVDAGPGPPPPALFARAPAEAAARILQPSDLGGAAGRSAEEPAYSPLRPPADQIRGRALHRLFELLPAVPLERRAAAADRLLERLAPDAAADERARWSAEAFAVLDDPRFAPVFTSAGRAEAPIAGVLGAGAGSRRFRGQIDRLCVADDRVLVVDFKTNRPPPRRLADVPAAYLAQLGAYRALLAGALPGRRIETALLWTYDARLMEIPAAAADHAFAQSLR